MLLGDRVVCYRDSAYLYLPLYHWIEEETQASGLPLWNPYEDFGYSPLADTSSALLYPGKLIFRLPLGTYTYRYGLYLSVHLLVASLGAAWMARRFGVRPLWSSIAGISFGFSGPVAFQTTNAIFLVGAAWLPWALGAYWMATTRRWIGWAVLTGMFLALMVLGGDPQMTFFTLWVVLASSFLFVSRTWFKSTNRWGEVGHQLTVPAVIVVSTLALSAAQLVPSWQATLQSERASSGEVRNIWQALASRNKLGLGENLKHLFLEPNPGTHSDAIYQFSQPPWTLAELFWPNVSGHLYPINTRWIDGFPAADRMWHATLYQSVLIVLFATCGVNTLRSSGRNWLIGLGTFFLCASFGWYGLGWLAHELGLLSTSSRVANPAGGIYWLMVTFLPGVDLFRYPAKVFPFVTLVIAVVGSLHAPYMMRSTFRPARVVSIFLIVAPISLPLGWLSRLNEHSIWQGFDWHFGPLEKVQALVQISVGLGTTSLLALVFWSLHLRDWRVRQSTIENLFAILIVLDLAFANRALLPLIDQTNIERDLKDQISQRPLLEKRPVVSLAPLLSQMLPEWRHLSSTNRLAEIFEYQIGIGTPKFNLLSHRSVLGSFTSIQNRNAKMVMNRFKKNEDRIRHEPIDTFLSAMKTPRSAQELVCAVLSHPQKRLNRSATEVNRLETLMIDNGMDLVRSTFREAKILQYSYSAGAFELKDIANIRGFLVFPISYDANWIAEFETADETISAPIHTAGGFFSVVEINSDAISLRLYQKPLFARFEIWLSIIGWNCATIFVFLTRERVAE